MMTRVRWRRISVHGPLGPPDIRVGVREHAHVLLERGHEVRQELHGHDDPGAHWRADHVLAFGFAHLFLQRAASPRRTSA